jgi:hypothetical protein
MTATSQNDEATNQTEGGLFSFLKYSDERGEVNFTPSAL